MRDNVTVFRVLINIIAQSKIDVGMQQQMAQQAFAQIPDVVKRVRF